MRPLVELAADVEVPSAMVAGWIMETAPPPPFVLFPNVRVTDDGQPVKIPMTVHQRLWKWPAMVGPINTAGGRPRMTATPAEIPTVDSGLSLRPMPTWPRGDAPMAPLPAYTLADPAAVPNSQQKAIGLRNVWTMDHPTLPMRAPLLAGGFVDGANARFIISGVTRDATGTPLGACTVTALRVPEMGAPLDPDAAVVAVVASDGSGVYTAQVPQNVPHQLIGYKAGAPDVAGVTLNTIMPVET